MASRKKSKIDFNSINWRWIFWFSLVAASFPFMQIDDGNLVDQLQIEKHGISETEADECGRRRSFSTRQTLLLFAHCYEC